MDGKEGLTTADKRSGHDADAHGKTCDSGGQTGSDKPPQGFPMTSMIFMSWDWESLLPLSAANMLNFGDVLDEVVASFPEGSDTEDDETIKVAVIGKPNVGKSSLINCIFRREARDSIAHSRNHQGLDRRLPFEKDGEKYILIDCTAGIRRKSKVNEDIERYSVVRAVAAIERCDVCILMIDAAEGLTEQDKKIAGVAHEAGKGIVVAVNEWDLIEKETNTMRDFKKEIESELLFMSYAPVIFISVAEKQRIYQVLEMAEYVAQKRAMRVPTGQLNSLIQDATMMKQPPSDKGKRLEDILCDSGGGKAAAVQLPDQ